MGRRELVLWAGALLMANNLVAALVAPHDAALGWSWLAQSRFGGFDVLAWGVVFWRLSKAPRRPARLGEVAWVLGLCLLGGLKHHMAAPLALTGLGVWLVATDEAETRAAAAVMLAIATRQLWSHLVFALVAPEMVKFDAAMVGQAVTLAVKGATWRDNIIAVPGGYALAVMEGCSSFSNVSASLLAWVALAKLERAGWVRRDLWVALAAVVAQVAMNDARLFLMAQSWPFYLYWHDGTGAQIYVAAASAVAVLIAAFGTRWAARDMTWLLRGVFIVLIAATVGWKLAAPPALEHQGDVARKVAAALGGRLSGPVASHPWGGPTNASLILTAPVASCSAPLTIVNVDPSFASLPALMQLQPPGGHHLFAYLDWVADQPDRWTLLGLRAHDKFKETLGLSPFTASDKMLFIAEPAGCDVARAVPWRRFWAAR